jgi:UDP-glucuronate 4-epimerase
MVNNENSILVTGGAGFIGSHLTEKLLKLGYTVICYDNFDDFYDIAIKRQNLNFAQNYKKFKLFEADINDKAALNRCFNQYKLDCVVHLAAKAGVRPSIADPIGYFSTNVLGTLNLLQVMKEQCVKKMVFASSSSVYGNNTKVPFSESDAVDNPISPYAASKKAAELLCHTFHHLYDFDIFCLRFFTVYGPRQRPDLAIHKFTEMIKNNQPIPVFGDGTSSRDYTYIDDIIEGVVKSIELVKGYEIINLGESKSISLTNMVATLEEALNKTAIKQHFSIQPGDVSTTFADITKAKEIIGYEPSMDFERGIQEFVKWKLT